MTELDFKNVQTRDGREVVICTTEGHGDCPVVGQVRNKKGDEWWAMSWTKDGVYNAKGTKTCYDLIPAPKRLQGWINLYRFGISGPYDDRKEAIKDIGNNELLACIYIDVKEGEGL